MSVTTTADERLDEAKEHLRKAQKALADIVIEECWGHDDYSEEFRSKIEFTFKELTTLRALLGKRCLLDIDED